MTIQTVPLAATPNQTFSVVLNDRDVGITVRSLAGQVYVDVVADGVAICAGQIARDRVTLTPRATYLGLPDVSLVFADLRGTSDPVWQDFGTRYVLLSVGDPLTNELPLSLPVPSPPPALLYDGSVTYNGSQTFDGNIA